MTFGWMNERLPLLILLVVCGCSDRAEETPPAFEVDEDTGLLTTAHSEGNSSGSDQTYTSESTASELDRDASMPPMPEGDGGSLSVPAADAGSPVTAASAPTQGATSNGPEGDPTSDGETTTSSGEEGCYRNPRTHLEIINACTTAVVIVKTPKLTGLNSDGSLPPLP